MGWFDVVVGVVRVFVYGGRCEFVVDQCDGAS